MNVSLIRTKDHTLLEKSTADSRIQIVSSECSTEISISSTLDLHDRLEAEGGKIVLKIGPATKEKYAANNGDGARCNYEKNLNAEANKSTQQISKVMEIRLVWLVLVIQLSKWRNNK